MGWFIRSSDRGRNRAATRFRLFFFSIHTIFCKFNATILKQHACTDSLSPLAPCRHKDQNTPQYIETHAAVFPLYSDQSFSGTTHPRVHLPPTANVRRDTDRCTGGLFYNEIFLANISLRTDFKSVDFFLGQCRDSRFFRIDGWIAGFPCGTQDLVDTLLYA